MILSTLIEWRWNICRILWRRFTNTANTWLEPCSEHRKKNLHREQESRILWLHQNILQERKWLGGKTWEHYLLTLKQNMVFIFVHILTSWDSEWSRWKWNWATVVFAVQHQRIRPKQKGLATTPPHLRTPPPTRPALSTCNTHRGRNKITLLWSTSSDDVSALVKRADVFLAMFSWDTYRMYACVL